MSYDGVRGAVYLFGHLAVEFSGWTRARSSGLFDTLPSTQSINLRKGVILT